MRKEKTAQSPSEKTEWWVGADAVGDRDQPVIPSEDLRIFRLYLPFLQRSQTTHVPLRIFSRPGFPQRLSHPSNNRSFVRQGQRKKAQET